MNGTTALTLARMHHYRGLQSGSEKRDQTDTIFGLFERWSHVRLSALYCVNLYDWIVETSIWPIYIVCSTPWGCGWARWSCTGCRTLGLHYCGLFSSSVDLSMPICSLIGLTCKVNGMLLNHLLKFYFRQNALTLIFLFICSIWR